MTGKIVEIPLLAIRNTVIFPVLAFPINVGREKSLKAVEKAMENDRLMGIVAQTDAKLEDPSTDELHMVGTAVKILKSVKMPGNKYPGNIVTRLNVSLSLKETLSQRVWSNSGSLD